MLPINEIFVCFVAIMSLLIFADVVAIARDFRRL